MQDNGLQNLFAITRFRCIEVPFHVFYYYSRVNKIVLYIEDFVILRGGGGGGITQAQVLYEKAQPRPLTLIYTSFDRKGTSSIILTNGTSFTYLV